jgi:hypothetical protein
MAECQSGGVEGLSRGRPVDELGGPPLHPGDPPAAPAGIDRITHHGVSHVLQVNPDLMGSPGMQLEPEEIDHIESGDDEGIGPGGAAAPSDSHALSIMGVTGEWGFDNQRAGIQVAPGECGIHSADPTGGDRCPQAAVRQIGLGHDHEARRVAIQPMHDPRAAFGAASESGAAGDQGIDQRIVPMTRRGVHHQPGRLIDNGEMLVFEDDVEWNRAGLKGARGLNQGEADGDRLASR